MGFGRGWGLRDGTHASSALARLFGASGLLQRAAGVAAYGGAAEGVAELVGELAAGLVQFFAFLEHAAAVLPGVVGRGHCVGCVCDVM